MRGSYRARGGRERPRRRSGTMGLGLHPLGGVPALICRHERHRALLREARASAPTVVMSLFVNPAQFGPGEDFARYPRDETVDVAIAGEEGADVVFAPGVETMYPADFSSFV